MEKETNGTLLFDDELNILDDSFLLLGENEKVSIDDDGDFVNSLMLCTDQEKRNDTVEPRGIKTVTNDLAIVDTDDIHELGLNAVHMEIQDNAKIPTFLQPGKEKTIVLLMWPLW